MQTNQPSWNSVVVTRHLPEKLHNLEVLSKNLWWCWNEEAQQLFRMVSPELWESTNHNPIEMLDKVKTSRYQELESDRKFLKTLDSVTASFNEYMDAKAERKGPGIAYFCMEYGLDTSLKIYSGGLGILAGDYLKETSDMNVNLVAVGLLYRYGYFTQMLSAQGAQIAKYDPQDFMKIPASPVLDADGNWITTSVNLPGRTLTARVWRVDVGRTELYLMDTDWDGNRPDDRQVTHHLYGGDWDNRLKQEILLGIGGIRALRKMGIHMNVYHCNEGHAAFVGLERIREYVMDKGLSYEEALEVVRSSSLFTTHTPVPAGHDAFDEGMLRNYLGHFPGRLNIDWDTLMGLGRMNPQNHGEKFSMSALAANISQEINGVSWLHGKVSQEIMAPMWPGYLPEENHVSYVTNGVHYPTWAAPEWQKIHGEVFGEEFATHHYDKKCFEGIYKVSDEEVWETRTILRKRLVSQIRTRLDDPIMSVHYSPRQIVTIKETLRDDVLTIGFARRFATYKRAHLLFRDLDRLSEIVNNPDKPVQFIFAGKAHPADQAGQDLIKMIVDISKRPEFIGKIVFVPNYDITLAKFLVQGVDVWMNNPTRPLEASGTSGEKAAMNGVMHFSVLDGWWVEGYRENAGWALPRKRTYDDQNYQDELDAATIYATFENEIVPDFYDIDTRAGYSRKWVSYIKNTIAQVACNFTTNRMLTDYVNQYYQPLYDRKHLVIADNFKMARDLAAWKKMMLCEWHSIEVQSVVKPSSSAAIQNEFESEVVLKINKLQPSDIGVEILFAVPDSKGKLHIQQTIQYECTEFKDFVARYRAVLHPDHSGMYQVAVRMYANNPALVSRQDFDLVEWL